MADFKTGKFDYLQYNFPWLITSIFWIFLSSQLILSLKTNLTTYGQSFLIVLSLDDSQYSSQKSVEIWLEIVCYKNVIDTLCLLVKADSLCFWRLTQLFRSSLDETYKPANDFVWRWMFIFKKWWNVQLKQKLCGTMSAGGPRFPGRNQHIPNGDPR